MRACCRGDGEGPAEASASSGPDHTSAGFSSESVPEARRLLQRFIGACNVQTDIKEAVFLGHNDELVAAGGRCPKHVSPFQYVRMDVAQRIIRTAFI